MTKGNLILRGGSVLVDPLAPPVICNVVIEGDTIARLDDGHRLSSADRVIDATGTFVLPGLANAHAHSPNILLRGMADRWTLEHARLRGPNLYVDWTPEDFYYAAALSGAEMLRGGSTAVCDQYLVPRDDYEPAIDAVMQAYIDIGIRAVAGPLVTDRSFPDSFPPNDRGLAFEGPPPNPISTTEALRIASAAVERQLAVAHPRITACVAPTVPGECSDELLIELTRLATSHQAPVHMHISESRVQAASSILKFGESVISRLARLGVLGPHLTAAHCVWVTENDLAQLRKHHCVVVHNPCSNLRFGSGIAPVHQMVGAGLTVGLGTDGALSADHQQMLEAIRLAALISAVRDGPYNVDRWLTAEDVWAMGTTGSAAALGLRGQIGAIAPGFKADLFTVRTDDLGVSPGPPLMKSLVFQGAQQAVETVMVGGDVVVSHGELTTVRESTLTMRASDAAARVRPLAKTSLPAEEDARLDEICRLLLSNEELTRAEWDFL
ncbi:MAG TPA: amidohydrolase family protein [Acidimicrobiia bacterium]|nr:amidohydrolase family protein [Acidimicrobiia bacterium]